MCPKCKNYMVSDDPNWDYSCDVCDHVWNDKKSKHGIWNNDYFKSIKR